MTASKYTKELLTEAVGNSFSVAGVLRYLNKPQAGGTQAHIAKLIVKYEIDTSHFTGQAHRKSKQAMNRKIASDILIVLPGGSMRPKVSQLRRAMLEIGVLHKCELCPTMDTWQGKPITLEVDHIDGDWLNNLANNLRFLCPNCHSQQTTSNMPHKFRS